MHKLANGLVGSHLFLPPWPRTVCPRFALQTVFLNCISAFINCILVFPTFLYFQRNVEKLRCEKISLAGKNTPAPLKVLLIQVLCKVDIWTFLNIKRMAAKKYCSAEIYPVHLYTCIVSSNCTTGYSNIRHSRHSPLVTAPGLKMHLWNLLGFQISSPFQFGTFSVRSSSKVEKLNHFHPRRLLHPFLCRLLPLPGLQLFKLDRKRRKRPNLFFLHWSLLSMQCSKEEAHLRLALVYSIQPVWLLYTTCIQDAPRAPKILFNAAPSETKRRLLADSAPLWKYSNVWIVRCILRSVADSYSTSCQNI